MPTRKLEARKVARSLYLEGQSTREIQRHPKMLKVNNGKPVANSSVSQWTRDLTRSKEIRAKFPGKFSDKKMACARKAAEVNKKNARQLRNKWQEEGRALFKKKRSF